MRHRWVFVAAALVLLLLAVPAVSAKTRAVGGPSKAVTDGMNKVQALYTPEEIRAGVYVGSDFCLACHVSKASYKETNHASFVRRPMTQHSLQPGKGVIADYDKNNVDDFIQGLDFNKIASPFDKYKPNAPVLSVDNGQYFVTIGSLKMPLWLTVAGQRNGSAQRYVVKIPVVDTPNKLSASAYFAPLQYTPGTGWAAYSPNNWYDATTNAPKFSAGIGAAAIVGPSNHTSGCIGCHATGVRGLEKTGQGNEWTWEGWTAVLFDPDDPGVFDYEGDGEYELMNIGCEACHGPGAAHIIAAGNPAKIANPAKLTAVQAAEVCGRCHVTSKSVPAGTFSWPYDDAAMKNWTPLDAKAGTPLKNFYVDTTALYPDGKHSSGGRPYHDYTVSAHANFAAHTISCFECHDPHAEGEGMLIREERAAEPGLMVKTAVEDNSLCLSCHAKYGPFAELTRADIKEARTNPETFAKVAKVVEQHTHHPYAPERIMGLSNCIHCHMSVAAGHSFDAISPEETLKYQEKGGMANSCAAGCHNNMVDVFKLGIKGTATTWNNPFDVKLANELKKFYGENGSWWQTPKP